MLVTFNFLVRGSVIRESRITTRGLAETASARRVVAKRLLVGNILEELCVGLCKTNGVYHQISRVL